MPYFVVHSGEDGTRIIELTKEQLLCSITPDKYGDTRYGSGGNLEFLGRVPQSDNGYWTGVPENAVLIIKGEIVRPKAVQVETKFEL